MILSGRAIEYAVANGDIKLDPYRRSQLNPASYDLTLGDEVCTYDFGPVYDVKQEPIVKTSRITEAGFVIHPGRGYLMHTLERVRSDVYVPVIDGKSSIGRLFVSIHQTAGFGDPGYDGQYTLEVTTLYSIRLYPGMRIAQIRFHAMQGEATQYAGKYVADAATGAVPSQTWRQFQ